MYNACVRSVFLYGWESWIKQSDMNMIHSFEKRCIRKIIPRGHAFSTNQIRDAADLSKRIKSLIQKRRSLGWAMCQGCPQNRFQMRHWKWRKNWRRPPGGLSTSWRGIAREETKRSIKLPKHELKRWKTE